MGARIPNKLGVRMVHSRSVIIQSYLYLWCLPQIKKYNLIHVAFATKAPAPGWSHGSRGFSPQIKLSSLQPDTRGVCHIGSGFKPGAMDHVVFATNYLLN